MKRPFAATFAIALFVFGAASAVATASQRAQLRDYSCHLAIDPVNRSISVKAVMKPLPGTQRMAVKFDLSTTQTGSTTAGGGSTVAASTVRGGDLGFWISPKNPTLGQLPGDVWRFDKSVLPLPAPAVYRFRVSFRWIGTRDHVIGFAVRFSQRCHQLELRPDLLVQSIAVTPIPGQPNQDLYTAVIGNAGATAAGPFEVLFAPADNTQPQTQTVARLNPYSNQALTFVGPACATAGPPTITADAALQVGDDLNRANNSMTAACPLPAPSGSASKGGTG